MLPKLNFTAIQFVAFCGSAAEEFKAIFTKNRDDERDLPEPKARVSYCHSAPSVVVRRPSVRKLLTFSTSYPEPLEGFWWNLIGMKYSWSLTSVVFRPDPPDGTKIGHMGSPSLSSFFRPEGYSNKPNAKQWSRSMWEEVLLFLVPFWSPILDAFLTSFWT